MANGHAYSSAGAAVDAANSTTDSTTGSITNSATDSPQQQQQQKLDAQLEQWAAQGSMAQQQQQQQSKEGGSAALPPSVLLQRLEVVMGAMMVEAARAMHASQEHAGEGSKMCGTALRVMQSAHVLEANQVQVRMMRL